MKNVIIDWESFYDKKTDVSVSSIGLPNYVEQSYAYLVSIVTDDMEFCGSPEEAAEALGDSWFKDPDLRFWAANSNFDQAWFERYFGKTDKDWHCILDLAAHDQYPRDLANVSRVLLGHKVDKSVRDEMNGVHYKDLPDAEQQRVLEYCLNDSVVEKKALGLLKPMSDIEAKIAAHTRMCNRRGVHIDTDKVERDKGYLQRIHHDSFKKIPWTKDGMAPLSYQIFAQYCHSFGVTPPKSLDKRDAACNAWIKANPDCAKILGYMRTYRGSNSKLEKLLKLQANLHNGVMPLELLYCGARHTRRWSSKGFNVQNLDKEAAFGDIMSEWPEFEGQDPKEIGIFMREYIIPPPGHIMGIIDYSQIEPRCLNWLVGNEEMLSAMRAGFEIYEAHAMAFHKWRGEAGTLKTSNKGLRNLCKVENLGLGYGMGSDRFREQAAINGMILTDKQAKDTVDAFRKGNPRTVAFWRMFDNKIKAAMSDKQKSFDVEMPTGDFLRYFAIRSQTKGGYVGFNIRGDFGKDSIQPRLWGGTVTENVTQRMARDVMAEAIVNLEAAGFPVLFHAHDEVILALPIQGAEKALEEAKELMKVPPAWAPDLPLGVDGVLSPHYTK